jgi:glycerol-3-phosphate dehydrogenase
LAAPTNGDGNSTKEISRDHKLIVSAKGLITITGGKWTTYRRMAEETVNLAITHAGLEPKACVTQNLSIHGSLATKGDHHLDIYGSDRSKIEALIAQDPSLGNKLIATFPYTEAEVVWSARNEMAETVEDILSRRLRVLFIDAQAAKDMAPRVASLLAKELSADKNWESNQIETFNKLADGYIYHSTNKTTDAALAN